MAPPVSVTLPSAISKAINDNDLAVAAVLSGNRNFEGRISPDVKMNYLASPPLVVAYAIAGTMAHDFENDALGNDQEGNAVYLRDIWPTAHEIQTVIESSISSVMFTKDYESVFDGDPINRTQLEKHLNGMRNQHMCATSYFEGMPKNQPVTDIFEPGLGRTGCFSNNRSHLSCWKH